MLHTCLHIYNVMFLKSLVGKVSLLSSGLDSSERRHSDKMPRLALSVRRSVLSLSNAGYSVADIEQILKKQKVATTKRSLYRLIKKFKEHGVYTDLQRRARDRKITPEMLKMINDELKQNDEATARDLRAMLIEKYPDLEVTLSTIKCQRQALGWVCTRPHYCQLIRNLNKTKRLVWCKEQRRVNEDFNNVIFSDECTIQLEHHGRLCFRKRKEPRKLKPRAKHPAKLHIWGAISARGAARVVMFTGIMDAVRYADILNASLVPFIADRFSDSGGHRFQMDNDPKHRSNHIEDYFEEKNINWWPTPPESPDLNPIENLWGSLKQYLRTKHKPRDLNQLKEGVLSFWQTLTPAVCRKYIGHLRKVIPKVIELHGEPSGY